MGLLSPYKSRERLLVYGNAGCGKTKAALDIAKAIDTKMWVADNDRAWERMLEGKDFAERVDFRDVRGEAYRDDVHPWLSMMEYVTAASRGMDRDDWLVVDMATIAWSWCQGYFTQEVFGREIDEYFVDARRRQVEAGQRGGNPFDGMMDWPAIGRMWDKFFDAVLNARGHVYLIAELAPIMDAGQVQDKVEVKNLYQRLGGKPKGQKQMDHVAQTVLWMGQTVKGDWVMTTAKDRERERMERLAWDDFGEAYLKGIAGWKPRAAVEAKRGKGAGQ